MAIHRHAGEELATKADLAGFEARVDAKLAGLETRLTIRLYGVALAIAGAVIAAPKLF